jgi:DNA (cytosine-5)-methyltransferase 1
MAWHYKRNVNPKHYFLCPIRDLLTADLPDELFNLDILDGSPPCSTFSMAGSREKAWGKKKHFREGQAEQVLSDLFFDWLDLVARLKPRVAIAENVKGMLAGNAKGYTKLVMQKLQEIGYRPQLFLVNSADCGVPQRRERVFFCALRRDINKPALKLLPRHSWIAAGEATKDLQSLTENEMRETKVSQLYKTLWSKTPKGSSFQKACEATLGKANWFTKVRFHDKQPAPTITSCLTDQAHWSEPRNFTFRELKRLGSFPDDYVAKSDKIGKYMIGMSVPPKMTEVVARAVIDQWLR